MFLFFLATSFSDVENTLELFTCELILNSFSLSFFSQECHLKRELDTKSFSTRLETSLAQCSHFSCPRFKSERHEFAIHHFAESVSYQVEGLVKKNKVKIFLENLTVCENEVSLPQYLVRVERKNTKLSLIYLSYFHFPHSCHRTLSLLKSSKYYRAARTH